MDANILTPIQYHQRVEQSLEKALAALTHHGYERASFFDFIYQAQADLFCLERALKVESESSTLLLVIYRSAQALLRYIAMSYDYAALQALKKEWASVSMQQEASL